MLLFLLYDLQRLPKMQYKDARKQGYFFGCNVCLLDPEMLVFLDEADLFFGNIAVAKLTLCILLGYLRIFFY